MHSDIPMQSEKAPPEIPTNSELNKLEIPMNIQSRAFHDEASLIALLDRRSNSKSDEANPESLRNNKVRNSF